MTFYNWYDQSNAKGATQSQNWDLGIYRPGNFHSFEEASHCPSGNGATWKECGKCWLWEKEEDLVSSLVLVTWAVSRLTEASVHWPHGLGQVWVTEVSSSNLSLTKLYREQMMSAVVQSYLVLTCGQSPAVCNKMCPLVSSLIPSYFQGLHFMWIILWNM